MMKLKGGFKFYKTHSYGVLEMPYQGKELSMVILLPHKINGLAKLKEDLTNDTLIEEIF